METKKCKFCGSVIEDNATKCPLCGMENDSADSGADTLVNINSEGGNDTSSSDQNTDIDSIISSLDAPTTGEPSGLNAPTDVDVPAVKDVDTQPAPEFETDKSTNADIDALISTIGEVEEPKPAEEPKPIVEPTTAPATPVAPAAKKSNLKWWIISIVVLLAAAAAGCGIGFYYLSTLENQDSTDDVNVAAREVLCDVVDESRGSEGDDVSQLYATLEVHRTFDYGAWSDLNGYFNADAVSMLDLGRYMVNTEELCYTEHRWSKPSLDRSATEAMVYAHPSLRIRTAPSTSGTSTIINGLLYGSKVRIIERVNNDWAEVEVLSGDFEHPDSESAYIGLRGYVHTQFLTTEKMFNIMNRHVTPSVERREVFNQTKWRRAMTDILYALGATPVSPVIDIDIAAKFERREIPESLLVLHINSSEENVELLAFVEFYESDEEYRILGIVPGTGVVMDGRRPCIEFNGVGDYDIIYLNE